ncbi:NmrA family transcriptional regulator, partial [Mycobacterium hackensackense]|nr:NmrA family transcriptional regulator [Mycobacterium hackensackense]
LIARGDKRPVITDPAAKYWGIDIDDDTLVPDGAATFFETRFADWILEQAATH